MTSASEASPLRSGDQARDPATPPGTLRRKLLWLNVLGGAAVLGSYTITFALSPELQSGLWGGVPEVLRPFYTVNMLLAAGGFLPLVWFLVLRGDAPGRVADRPDWWLPLFFTLILVPSALWLPLTAWHLAAGGALLGLGIRLVLYAVAIGASGLAFEAFRSARRDGGTGAWLRAVAFVPFWIQTALLDALIWPAFYDFG